MLFWNRRLLNHFAKLFTAILEPEIWTTGVSGLPPAGEVPRHIGHFVFSVYIVIVVHILSRNARIHTFWGIGIQKSSNAVETSYISISQGGIDFLRDLPFVPLGQLYERLSCPS